MRIAISSQNGRTVTGHAGKTRRFIVYEADDRGVAREVERIELATEETMHAFEGDDHPLFRVDAVVTTSCGERFVEKLAQHGVRAIATSLTDPLEAAQALGAGRELPPGEPHEH